MAIAARNARSVQERRDFLTVASSSHPLLRAMTSIIVCLLACLLACLSLLFSIFMMRLSAWYTAGRLGVSSRIRWLFRGKVYNKA